MTKLSNNNINDSYQMANSQITAYQTKCTTLSGTSYAEVYKQARRIYNEIARKTKRKPYVRSIYFKKEKIFFDFFWHHLRQKRPSERFMRLKFFVAAIEIIKLSHHHSSSKINPNRPTEILHRFAGITKDRQGFYVQIKENRRSQHKYLMSCFPSK